MKPRMQARERIIEALEKSGKTRQALAEKLGVSRGAVSDMLNKETEIDSLKYIEATAELTGFSFMWIATGKDPDSVTVNDLLKIEKATGMQLQGSPIGNEPDLTSFLSGKTIRPVTVTVDRFGKELISYVPVRAQAGYKRGFGDPHYIEKLPAYSLPINVAGTHRMFQVDGNSMRQLGGGGLNDGDIVIASYVEDIFSLKDGRVYVIISTDGVIIKRCINRLLTDDRVLVANSDNKSGEYPPIILHPNEILEVWELKAYISKQLSLATDLWDVLNDMQVKMALMEDKLKGLEMK